MNNINTQQVPGTKSVSQRENSMCIFHKRKKQLVTRFSRKPQDKKDLNKNNGYF